ncbi:sulfite exporter TauE/SafE family protein [Neiella marina]|uniref:Sulfite exporter TauE/SafE family protein n=1 Tax=Neiella holothuriorum TaxID=2870530 RepID=A0ABS7EGR6_9GAMM|nr:sulfite exporter TauE/SafE family protein [Neiella holothuriorum]MBW8191515.1 sulfite exporter TauE/SafE family protein [Neiella holothuriorum]
MIDWTFVSSLFVIGLLGSGHCIGMCGGLSVAFNLGSQGSQTQRLVLLFVAQMGRLTSYAFIGALFGWSLSLLQHFFDAKVMLMSLRVFANVMLILMGLYVARWWFGLAKLEALAKPIWQRIKPQQQRFLPIKNAKGAFVVGLCWGWLPCGLVYSALATSVSQANAANAAMAMLMFGLGTLPSVWLTGAGASIFKKLLNQQIFRTVAGLMLIIFASNQLFQLI